MIGLIGGIILALFAAKLARDEDWHWIGILLFAGAFFAVCFFLQLLGVIFGAVALGAFYRAMA